MNKLLALAVVGCGLWFAAPGQATQLQGGIPQDAIKKTQRIDITGTLEWAKGRPDPRWDYTTFTGHVIQVEGITYQLINIDARAAALLGQRVRVKGVLTTTTLTVGRISNGNPVSMEARLVIEHRVAVTEIAPVQNVEVSGKLDMHARFGYPGFREVPTIGAGDQNYVLTFASAALEKFAAKYNGKTIVLRGTSGPNESFPVMCKGPMVVPSLIVREIEVVDGGMVLKASAQHDGVVQVVEHWEMRGKLIHAPYLPESMGYAGLWCMIEVNGTNYWLDLASHEPQARKLLGQSVGLTGTFGRRTAGPEVITVVTLRKGA